MSGEDAASRKRRLQELRNKAKGTSEESTVSNVASEEAPPQITVTAAQEDEHAAKKPKFRNYQPFDKKLTSTDSRVTNSTYSTTDSENNRAQTNGQAEEDKSHQSSQNGQKKSILQEELEKLQNDEINLVPKKVNADLKQQVASKLEKLKRRTQKAIVEILREKLSMEAIDE